jgi:hypothetical protein
MSKCTDAAFRETSQPKEEERTSLLPGRTIILKHQRATLSRLLHGAKTAGEELIAAYVTCNTCAYRGSQAQSNGDIAEK